MGTVLVVEDEGTLREVMRIAWESSDCRVLPAESGVQAVQMCREYRSEIDVLVSDLQLPDLTARDLIPRILEIRPTMKVLAISGFAEDFVCTILHLGGHSILSKPFELAELVRRVWEIATHAKGEPCQYQGRTAGDCTLGSDV